MKPPRRLFVLLANYEDLTEREGAALRRGDIEHAIALEGRKRRLAEAMAAARRNAGLSNAEGDAYIRRVRSLEVREKENLAALREEMARTRAALDHLNQAAHRTRKVRRGYGGGFGLPVAEPILGRA
jgi:hypothetical protein